MGEIRELDKAGQEVVKAYQEKSDVIQVKLEAKVEICQGAMKAMQEEMEDSQVKMEAI
jgi:hypothetical protein